MNCIMYSILVNPTHAVTGALAPSSPFCGFIFSFSCDLIFFSFSLFLTPLWLCIGDRPVYLTDFAPLLPQISPCAHTPMFSAGLGPGPRSAILSPSPPAFPKIRLPPLGLISSVVHPASVPTADHYFHLWNSFPSPGTGSRRSRAPAGVASLGSVFAIQH